MRAVSRTWSKSSPNFWPCVPVSPGMTVWGHPFCLPLQLTLVSTRRSFGSAVGAPVVFFVGAFIYNMVDIQTRLGDNDTAHALAFGMCESFSVTA